MKTRLFFTEHGILGFSWDTTENMKKKRKIEKGRGKVLGNFLLLGRSIHDLAWLLRNNQLVGYYNSSSTTCTGGVTFER